MLGALGELLKLSFLVDGHALLISLLHLVDFGNFSLISGFLRSFFLLESLKVLLS